MAYDPYPLSSVLTIEEVMGMLRMGRTAFKVFTETELTFPKPIVMGKTKKKGRPILRYRKEQILWWLDTREKAG